MARRQQRHLWCRSKSPWGPPPPAGFEAYENSAASGGVLGRVLQITSGAKAVEAEAIRSEEGRSKPTGIEFQSAAVCCLAD